MRAIEIADTYNALFGEEGAPEIPDEDEVLTEGEAQATEVAGIAERAEQQAGTEAGEVVRHASVVSVKPLLATGHEPFGHKLTTAHT